MSVPKPLTSEVSPGMNVFTRVKQAQESCHLSTSEGSREDITNEAMTVAIGSTKIDDDLYIYSLSFARRKRCVLLIYAKTVFQNGKIKVVP